MLYIQNLTRARVNKNFLEKILKRTLKIVGVKQRVEISLVIVSNKKIKELNERYRGIDKITDVLSFSHLEASFKKIKKTSKPQKQKAKLEFIQPPDKILHLGEIFISYQKAKVQSHQHRHSIRKEMALLFIHGILHLLGYEHARKKEAREMQELERKILSFF